MHQKAFGGRAPPGPAGGSSIAAIWEPTSKGRGGKGREREGREGERRKGREELGKSGAPHFFVQVYAPGGQGGPSGVSIFPVRVLKNWLRHMRCNCVSFYCSSFSFCRTLVYKVQLCMCASLCP